MNRSRRRRLALRVLAVAIGMGALGLGGIAFAADSGTSVTPGQTVIAPATTPTTGFAVPSEIVWN